MTALSVNLNKVALLRNARDGAVPDVVRAATACLDAGAHGLTLHPRPDGRHARPDDVLDFARLARSRGAELNVEGFPSSSFLDLVERAAPAQCTLVPDAPDQRTSDHGWDVAAHRHLLERAVARLHAGGVRVSLFVDADADAVRRARDVGADRVELYTGPFARAFALGDAGGALEPYARAAAAAREAGLAVNAGHDLSLENLGTFCARVPGIAEVSIGHALIADALFHGLAATVRSYLAVLAPRSAVPAGG